MRVMHPFIAAVRQSAMNVARAWRRLKSHSRRADENSHKFPQVQTFEWRPTGGGVNFGDHLGTVIVNRILSSAGLTPGEETGRSATLFSVGSVLHFAKTGDVVWGAGVNGKVDPAAHTFRDLDVRAVRGPKTAEFLRLRRVRVPDVFGDPALLVAHLFGNRFKRSSARPVLIVPNLHDVANLQTHHQVLSPFAGWNRVVQEIVSSDFVVASSLHGLIVAEAFGIPARYVRLSETESLFKYEDYVLATGRQRLDPAWSVDEALEMGGMPPITFDAAKLLDAFPWDLWGLTRPDNSWSAVPRQFLPTAEVRGTAHTSSRC